MKETDLEAVATVVQRVAGVLRHLKQLDKVEQYYRREAQKKASVTAKLKVPIQMYRVCMGLSKPTMH